MSTFNEEGPSKLFRTQRERKGEQQRLESARASLNTPSRIKTEFSWRDSRIDEHPGLPTDSSFETTFLKVIPRKYRGFGLGLFLLKELDNAGSDAIAIEYGGPGSQFFRDINSYSEAYRRKKALARSLGVTLSDIRNIRERDFDLHAGHDVIEGDMLHDATEAKVDTWLAGKKAHLIIERLAKGMHLIPADPYYAMKTLQRWYARTDEQGTLLVQTPVSLNPFLRAWAKAAKKVCGNTLDIQFDAKGKNDTTAKNSALRIRKHPGAPKALPELDVRTVTDIVLKATPMQPGE